MEKILTPKCHICQETDFRALYCDEVYKARAPKSQKTILDIIRHISRVLKVTFTVPARARVCTVCYKELVRYDCYVVELLEVQKRLSDKINARVKGIKLPKPVDRPVDKEKKDIKQEDNENFDDDDDGGDDDGEIEAIEDSDDDDNDAFDDDNIFVDPDVDTEPSASGQQEQKVSVENQQDNYPCPVCNLKLKNQRALDYHLDKDHKNRVTCTVCGVQVRNDEYLVLHMNIHNGKTENDCSFCGKSYARRVNVIRHMQVHFNKKKHQCERCGMFFSQTTIFYNHRLQHEAEDNPLICPVCSQTFKTIRTYKRHMVTHQEDRPRYNCEFCGKVFVDKYTLKMHVRTHHTSTTGGDESEEQSATQAQKKVKTAPAEEPDHVIFTCVICQHIFVRQDLFADHMQNVHDVVMDS
ncbi:serendipity locus protein delta-like [Calliphora vicina]|uniref:serendipity locus protein delta-like n=1 Tax=Calliphora vicina TaxID=7373 RepID=UPI00325B7DD1